VLQWDLSSHLVNLAASPAAGQTAGASACLVTTLLASTRVFRLTGRSNTHRLFMLYDGPLGKRNRDLVRAWYADATEQSAERRLTRSFNRPPTTLAAVRPASRSTAQNTPQRMLSTAIGGWRRSSRFRLSMPSRTKSRHRGLRPRHFLLRRA
jgi:hypothetical protein